MRTYNGREWCSNRSIHLSIGRSPNYNAASVWKTASLFWLGWLAVPSTIFYSHLTERNNFVPHLDLLIQCMRPPEIVVSKREFPFLNVSRPEDQSKRHQKNLVK